MTGAGGNREEQGGGRAPEGGEPRTTRAENLRSTDQEPWNTWFGTTSEDQTRKDQDPLMRRKVANTGGQENEGFRGYLMRTTTTNDEEGSPERTEPGLERDQDRRIRTVSRTPPPNQRTRADPCGKEGFRCGSRGCARVCGLSTRATDTGPGHIRPRGEPLPQGNARIGTDGRQGRSLASCCLLQTAGQTCDLHPWRGWVDTHGNLSTNFYPEI